MSQPGPDARISNLEKEAISLGGRIEEAAADTAESFRDLKQDVNANFTAVRDDIKQGFAQAYTFVQEQFGEIKSAMATKEDVRKLEARLDSHEDMLRQILDRLPPKP